MLCHWLLNRTRPLLGLEITSEAIILTALRRRWHSYQLRHYAYLPRAEQELDCRQPEILAKQLQPVLEQLPSRYRQVAIALPDHLAMLKTMTLPKQHTAALLAQQVLQAAAAAIPYPLAEIYLDFIPLPANLNTPEQQPVLLVAAHRETIQNYLAMLAKTPLQVQMIDLASYAVARAAKLLVTDSATLNVAVLQVNREALILVVIKQQQLLFRHVESLPHSLDALSWNKSLQQSANRALQCLLSTLPQQPVNQIFLAGSQATASLAEQLSQTWPIPLQIANPLINLQVRNNIDRSVLTKTAPALLSSCGLALANHAIATSVASPANGLPV